MRDMNEFDKFASMVGSIALHATEKNCVLYFEAEPSAYQRFVESIT